MTCRLRWCGRNRNQVQNSNMADVWANSMACHPRAICRIAGCCHLSNSVSWFQSYVSHCRVLPLGEIAVTIPECHIAGCKNSIRHILFIFVSNRHYSSKLLTNGGVECRWGRHQSPFCDDIWLLTLLPAMSIRRHRTTVTVPQVDTSLVVSGGVCWWRERTAKCLWQEVSTLCQRQQNNINNNNNNNNNKFV